MVWVQLCDVGAGVRDARVLSIIRVSLRVREQARAVLVQGLVRGGAALLHPWGHHDLGGGVAIAGEGGARGVGRAAVERAELGRVLVRDVVVSVPHADEEPAEAAAACFDDVPGVKCRGEGAARAVGVGGGDGTAEARCRGVDGVFVARDIVWHP